MCSVSDVMLWCCKHKLYDMAHMYIQHQPYNSTSVPPTLLQPISYRMIVFTFIKFIFLNVFQFPCLVLILRKNNKISINNSNVTKLYVFHFQRPATLHSREWHYHQFALVVWITDPCVLLNRSFRSFPSTVIPPSLYRPQNPLVGELWSSFRKMIKRDMLMIFPRGFRLEWRWSKEISIMMFIRFLV